MAAHTVGDVYRVLSQEIRENGGFHGIADISKVFKVDEKGEVAYPPTLVVGNSSGGFTCPDGTIVAILDNIDSAADMNRVLSHESGHAAGGGDPAARNETRRNIRFSKSPQDSRRMSRKSRVPMALSMFHTPFQRRRNGTQSRPVWSQSGGPWVAKEDAHPSRRHAHPLYGAIAFRSRFPRRPNRNVEPRFR